MGARLKLQGDEFGLVLSSLSLAVIIYFLHIFSAFLET